ncbi:MAG TPA: hypothetical protein VMP01_03020, partial [Pirellulaceae bacterium]|nr:hypothetical protein [Pirellulaceae bacterium]
MIEGSLALELPVKADGETALSVPLIVRERAGIARVNEPVTLGVPLPRGYAMPGQKWVVEDEAAAEGAAGCQTRPLALWRDGSVKWLLTTMAASCEPHGSRRVRLTPGKATGRAAGVTVVRLADRIEVDTSRGVFTLPAAGEVLLSRANVSGREVLSAAGIAAELSDDRGRVHRLRLDGIEVLEEGPLRVQVAFRGRFARMGLNCFGVWTFHANSAAVQLEITLHNPSRARHQSGCWDLGDPGSVRLREFAVRLCPAGDAQERVQWCEDGQPRWSGQSDNEVEIYQASSGGEAFDSRNHVNAAGQIPIEFRGYRVQCDGTVRFGLRAQPIAALQRGENWIAATVAEFWQQFPKAMNADEEGVRIGLFPAQFADGHELQGGEQKTHRIALDFGACGESDPARLACLIHPLEVRCDREWLSATEAILNLPPANVALRAEWQAMADDALAGERSFFAKREVIDEYGWRNYGDLWADHEEAYYDGPRPIISHYNNQYDGLQGFLLSYLTTEDRRWWDLADPLARHIIDIDIYHTQHDRAVYSGG